MATEYVEVLNTSNGRTGKVPQWVFEHPKFNQCLVLAEGKPPVPELFVPRSPEEHEAKPKRGRNRASETENAPNPEQEEQETTEE